MNQYRCETCKYNDNGYCEVFDYRLYSSEIDTLAVFGCASHSDFQSGWDTVLDILDVWLNSDDHLSLFKWEVRGKIRELRQAGSP